MGVIISPHGYQTPPKLLKIPPFFRPLSTLDSLYLCELIYRSEQLRSYGLVLFYLYYPYVYYIVHYSVYVYWVYYRMDIKKGYTRFY